MHTTYLPAETLSLQVNSFQPPVRNTSLDTNIELHCRAQP